MNNLVAERTFELKQNDGSMIPLRVGLLKPYPHSKAVLFRATQANRRGESGEAQGYAESRCRW